ncbi:MAG: hypothetical protein ACWA5W_05240 [Phycisphaerales bacterium]
MTTKASKALPYLAGIAILLIVVGFMLGLKVVIEYDAANHRVRTTKLIYSVLPISTTTEPLWADDHPSVPANWELMHRFHYSAAGTKIKHTHWGAVVDPILLWHELNLPNEAKAALAARINELIESDRTLLAKRVYIRRIDFRLKAALAQSESPITPMQINALIDESFIKPIDDEAAMIPDP